MEPASIPPSKKQGKKEGQAYNNIIGRPLCLIQSPCKTGYKGRVKRKINKNIAFIVKN